MRVSIDSPAYKCDNEDDANSLDEHNFYVRGKDGEDWETTKGTIKMTKRARGRSRRNKRGRGKTLLPTMKN